MVLYSDMITRGIRISTKPLVMKYILSPVTAVEEERVREKEEGERERETESWGCEDQQTKRNVREGKKEDEFIDRDRRRPTYIHSCKYPLREGKFHTEDDREPFG